MIANRVPAPAFQCRSGENRVTPAHSSGAAASSGSESGMRTTKFWLTTTAWLYPPCVTVPSLSMEL
jgi:hypothetical protein